jgi:hypothetical protein
MATLIPPKKGTAYTIEVGLVSQVDENIFKTSPTLAVGDVTISKDGGSFVNIDALPSEIGSSGVLTLNLMSAEMGADRVVVKFHDVAGAEWRDLLVIIQTVSTQLDDLAPEDMWAHTPRTLTQSAAVIASTVAGSIITFHRGDSFSADLTGLGDISGRTKLWFTVKAGQEHADTLSIVQIEESAGLLYLNGADASARSSNGAITVTDAVAGDITITLDEVETDDLVPVRSLYYDVQMLTAAGAIRTLTAQVAKITADVTRAVS